MTKLQAIRLDRGLTQRETSRLAGVNHRTYQLYDQGAKRLDHARLDTILRICVVLDCDIEEIIEEPEWLALYGEYIKKEE